jgi:excisionase family DNA binding protein
MKPRDALVQLIDHPELPTPALSRAQAFAVIAQLSALQSRVACAAATGPESPSDEAADDECLEIAEVAALLKMDLSYVYRMVRRKQLPAIRQGRAWRVTRGQLRHYLEQQASSNGA